MRSSLSIGFVQKARCRIALTVVVLEEQMDCTAAVHRLKIGVPATVEHNAEEGVESSQWIAETTQVCLPWYYTRGL